MFESLFVLLYFDMVPQGIEQGLTKQVEKGGSVGKDTKTEYSNKTNAIASSMLYSNNVDN